MNKKASSIVLAIGEVIVLVTVMWMVIAYAERLANSERVAKVSTADNFMLMINTLVGTPGEAVVAYPHNISRYNMILNQDSISVISPGEDKSLWEVRKFNLPQGYGGEGVVQSKEKVCLEKKNKKILLRECHADE